MVLNNLLWKLPSVVTVLGLDFVPPQSTDLLCGTLSLHSKYSCKYCRVKAFSGYFKLAVVRTSSSDIAATVRLTWFCHVSTHRASEVGFTVDAAGHTHCWFRCACPHCSHSSAFHSAYLRKRKPHLQFPTTGLLTCLHVLLSPGHSSQGSWPTTDFLGLPETPQSSWSSLGPKMP